DRVLAGQLATKSTENGEIGKVSEDVITADRLTQHWAAFAKTLIQYFKPNFYHQSVNYIGTPGLTRVKLAHFFELRMLDQLRGDDVAVLVNICTCAMLISAGTAHLFSTEELTLIKSISELLNTYGLSLTKHGVIFSAGHTLNTGGVTTVVGDPSFGSLVKKLLILVKNADESSSMLDSDAMCKYGGFVDKKIEGSFVVAFTAKIVAIEVEENKVAKLEAKLLFKMSSSRVADFATLASRVLEYCKGDETAAVTLIGLMVEKFMEIFTTTNTAATFKTDSVDLYPKLVAAKKNFAGLFVAGAMTPDSLLARGDTPGF
ncbi:unnamed protein product, partial [Prorocentrum cordatum]